MVHRTGREERQVALANVEACRVEYQIVIARANAIVAGFDAETARRFGLDHASCAGEATGLDPGVLQGSP